ncbi:parathyroid hormone/parathyroid hormone-related peptide receptor-like [Liolophura sinensis]|uniref:parathyroid hormone/parathyroid hormone-related peptide receptor-like n=1 Tax=Liolophura sinensis TaxID=3198878 RepID=UPI003158F861
MSREEQTNRLLNAQFECHKQLISVPYPRRGEYCNRTWDNIMCWMETPVGTVAKQHCPSYVSGFDTTEFATRECLADGTWYVHPEHNGSWTNYSACKKETYLQSVPRGTVPPLVAHHLPYIRLLSNVGYGVSLGALILAVIIMLLCRRLRSKSNVLHVNLFLAFILRAGTCLLRETLLVQGLALPGDFQRLDNGELKFIEEGTHWECKLLFTVFHYSLGTSYMWIFAEGIYLHMLVYNTLWTERHGVKPYIVFGWASPLLFLCPWVVVRALCDNALCWNTHPTPEFYWIMKGPIVASIVINFVFFMDIVRILTIRASRRQDENRYRKLAKFTLVLIPLFGVMYIIFVAFPPDLPEETETPYLYAEMFINSFQGFLLALLFCFLNEEVHLELKKIWTRHKMRRRDSYLLTRSFVVSSTVHASSRRKGSALRQGYDTDSIGNHHATVIVKGDKPSSHLPGKPRDQHYEMKTVCNGKAQKGRRKVYSFSRRDQGSNGLSPLHSDRSQSDDSKHKPEAV